MTIRQKLYKWQAQNKKKNESIPGINLEDYNLGRSLT